MYEDDRKYSKEHEWIRIDGDGGATIGVTFFAQEELGDVVFVELPEVGASFDQDEEIGTIESVKAVSSLFTPVAGKISEVNEEIVDRPELVNEDPHGEGWLVRLEAVAAEQLESLMSAEEYQEHIASD
jgi:glycine cleavage system H protein